MFERVSREQGKAPIQPRWGTDVVGTVPEGPVGHEGLPSTGWMSGQVPGIGKK